MIINDEWELETDELNVNFTIVPNLTLRLVMNTFIMGLSLVRWHHLLKKK
jgi:hypothetical protein